MHMLLSAEPWILGGKLSLDPGVNELDILNWIQFGFCIVQLEAYQVQGPPSVSNNWDWWRSKA